VTTGSKREKAKEGGKSEERRGKRVTRDEFPTRLATPERLERRLCQRGHPEWGWFFL